MPQVLSARLLQRASAGRARWIRVVASHCLLGHLRSQAQMAWPSTVNVSLARQLREAFRGLAHLMHWASVQLLTGLRGRVAAAVHQLQKCCSMEGRAPDRPQDDGRGGHAPGAQSAWKPCTKLTAYI